MRLEQRFERSEGNYNIILGDDLKNTSFLGPKVSPASQILGLFVIINMTIQKLE